MSAEAALLWVPFTIGAALAQVVRNGAQAGLTTKIDTMGATQVRFVFGLPFAILFYAGLLMLRDIAPVTLNLRSVVFVGAGALCQIGATALMLVVMRQRAFGVAYAYIKTEPVLVAVMGAVLIGDRLPLLGWAAVMIVTVGVMLAAVKPGHWRELTRETRMIAAGVAAGGLFGLSAIAFRAGIGALEHGDFLVRSLAALVLALAIQCMVLGIWLGLRDRAAFAGSLREWRQSLGAGLMGAVASACWFTAFSLTAAANVRTLGLIEIPLAALFAGRLTGKGVSRAEALGLGTVMAGVGLLLYASA